MSKSVKYGKIRNEQATKKPKGRRKSRPNVNIVKEARLDRRKEIKRMEVTQEMGMTDKQFNGFVRFVLDDIKEVLEGMPESKEKEKLEKVAENLQKTLED